MIDAQSNWRLGFSHSKWNLQPNQSFPIVLTFDGQAPVNVMGTPLSSTLVTVEMPTQSALIAQFRKSKAMSAFAQGQLFQFNLNSTSQLLPALANCVVTIKRNGIAGAGDFTVAAAPPTAPKPPPSIGGSLNPNSSASSSPEMQIEALELVSNFVVKSGLRSPKVLSCSETPVDVAAFGAAWKSEEASGFVRIIPPRTDMKGLDVAAAVVGNDAKDCKGKFASARRSELVDSDVVFQGFSSCDDSDGLRTANYFIVPRRKGGFVMFSVLSNMKSEVARTITTDEKVGDFRKAALIAVGQ